MVSLNAIDLYQTGNSPIHSLDPRVKISFVILLILSNVLLPDGAWISYLITWLIVLGLTILSQVTLTFILKRSLIAIPFALVAVTVIFSVPGETLTELHLKSSTIIITVQGMIRFISILIRAWLSIQATILLTATTSFPDLAHGLRHLHIPLIIIAILSFMYRYLFILGSEAQRLLQARTARSATRPGLKKPSIFWEAKNAGNMVGQLFLRSYERSDRVYDAMVARGFQGEFLTYHPHRMNSNDWIGFVIALLIISTIQLINLII